MITKANPEHCTGELKTPCTKDEQYTRRLYHTFINLSGKHTKSTVILHLTDKITKTMTQNIQDIEICI